MITVVNFKPFLSVQMIMLCILALRIRCKDKTRASFQNFGLTLAGNLALFQENGVCSTNVVIHRAVKMSAPLYTV